MGKLKDTKDLIRELADMLEQSGLTEIEIEDEDVRIRVVRQRTSTVIQAPPAAPTVQPASGAAPQTAESATMQIRADEQPDSGEADGEATTDFENHPGMVTSPMVGTAYMAPEPGAQPFVSEGEYIEEGQTLMIVEAMKVMNHIPAPQAGTVKKILVDDAVPVEFGQPLMVIE